MGDIVKWNRPVENYYCWMSLTRKEAFVCLLSWIRLYCDYFVRLSLSLGAIACVSFATFFSFFDIFSFFCPFSRIKKKILMRVLMSFIISGRLNKFFFYLHSSFSPFLMFPNPSHGPKKNWFICSWFKLINDYIDEWQIIFICVYFIWFLFTDWNDIQTIVVIALLTVIPSIGCLLLIFAIR